MENIQELDDLDALHIEQQLREKIYELQLKSDSLEKTREELLETRHALYDAKLNLESYNKTNNELKMQLLAAIAMINRLKDEKKIIYIEQMQLKTSYEGMFNERDSLIEQIRVVKSELAQINEKIQVAECKICDLEILNTSLEESLEMLKKHTLPMITTAESEITKLKKEYHHLQDSCQRVIELNKRLQTVGLCAHTICQMDKIQIKKLQYQLTCLSIDDLKPSNYNAALHPEIEKICEKLQTLFKELKLSL